MKQYVHASKSTYTPMRFSVFVPPGASVSTPAPVLYWLSGLTCTDENFTQKAGCQRYAAEHNIILVAPDTSPRPDKDVENGRAPFEGENDSYDFGSGAGFYVDATEDPWAGKGGYNMFSYVNSELPEVVQHTLEGAACEDRCSIFGHSMGGHGALISALRNPGRFKSVSAFAPISNPTRCPWGQKAFNGYLGTVDAGKKYDATELAAQYTGEDPVNILIDTGTADNFFKDGQLLPENFEAACRENAGGMIKCESRLQEGYDHSYNFIASFMQEHVSFHAKHLQ